MKPEFIISFHLPKSGGTSFAQILKTNWKNNLFLEYSSEECQFENAQSLDDNIKIIHGHLCYEAYSHLMRKADLITFLRDPVERLLSLYHHLNIAPHHGGKLGLFVSKHNPSFIDFAKSPLAIDYGFSFLQQFDPSQFKFIGFVESFDESIKRFYKTFNLSKKPSFCHINKIERKLVREISKNEYNSIRDINKKQFIWYENALAKFSNNYNL